MNNKHFFFLPHNFIVLFSTPTFLRDTTLLSDDLESLSEDTEDVAQNHFFVHVQLPTNTAISIKANISSDTVYDLKLQVRDFFL